MVEPPFFLTPATEADYAWLWELKRLTMTEYVEQTWGTWDEELQEEFFRKNFSPDTVQIVMIEGQRAGLLQVEHEASEMFLANIQIHPKFQHRGLGTSVVRSVMESAASLGLPVRLQVLKVNTAAQRLYQRLGFACYGENLTHHLLRWQPRAEPL